MFKKKSDYTNGLINYSFFFITILNRIVMKIIMLCYCKMQGIQLKKGSVFQGKMRFMKSRTGTIEIGEQCTFLSTHTSNLIGINRPCIFSALSSEAILKIGNNCGFSGTVIGCFSRITIGNNVRCGANTLITDSDWHQDDFRSGKAKPIELKDNVWLGEGVKVLKGVVIGENSIIGAGSVVTKDIPANVIAAGNPCKIIKPINNK